jgi:hypothetical protein
MSLDVYLLDPSATYETEPLYRENITHNLSKMADKADVGKAVWNPEELNITFAKELIPYIEKGLKILMSDSKHYKQLFNLENECGNYDVFVRFLEIYLIALKKYPEAKIKVQR